MKATDNSVFLEHFVQKGFAPLLPKFKRVRHVSASPNEPRDIKEVLSCLMQIASDKLNRLQDDFLFFHASAFSYKNSATVILGDAGSGKSSLCFAAGLLGARIISDEPVLVNKETFLVTPFRYFIKIEGFRRNFSNWTLSSKIDFGRNRAFKKNGYNFNLLNKDDLLRLNINCEDKKLPVKNIIFLEKKRYNPVIQLLKHCLTKGENPYSILRSLNNLICKKNLIYMPDLEKKLCKERIITDILRNILI